MQNESRKSKKSKAQETTEDPLALEMELFSRVYPTAQAQVDELCRVDDPDREYVCKRCGAHGLERIDARTMLCPTCHTKTWLTAGTFFEGIRDPMHWLFAIWLFERRVQINANRFANFLGASYGAIWKMFQKMGMVLDDLIRQPDVDGVELVSSRVFAKIIFRRSIETPAGSHPLAEQLVIDGMFGDEPHLDEPHLDEISSDEISSGEISSDEEQRHSAQRHETHLEELQLGEELTAVQKIVFESLTEVPVWFDVLRDRLDMEPAELASTLTLLEFTGVIIRFPGERFARLRQGRGGTDELTEEQSEDRSATPGSSIATRVSNAIDFVRATYQGVSRKRLQHYLAVYCFFVNPERWPQGSLLAACRRADPISDLQVRSYVSPPLVTI